MVFEGTPEGLGFSVSGALSGVTVRGAGLGGISLAGTLESVVAEDCELFGVLVEGGAATLTDVEVLGTRRSGATGGYGLDISGGAVVEVIDSDLHGNWNRNVQTEESTVTFVGTSIRDGVSTTNGTGGYGIFATVSSVFMEDSLVDNNENVGIYVTGESDVTLVDSVISNTYSETDAPAMGVDGRSGSFVMTGGALLANNGGGVITSNGFSVEVDGVEIADHEVTRAQLVGGYGLDALSNTTLVIRNCWIHDNMATGFLADGATSIVVEDIVPAALSDTGHGIEVAQGGRFVLTDATVARVAEAGVLCDGEGSTAVFERVDITDITGSSSRDIGLGIHAQNGCAVSATSVKVERPLFIGLGAFQGGASLNLDDVDVLDVQVTEDGEFGWGAAISYDANLVARDLLIDGSVGAGIQVAQESYALIEDSTIRNVTRPAEHSSAFGIGVQQDVTVEIDGLVVEAIEGPGISCAIADISCTDCSVSDVAFAGLALEACNASIVSSSVENVVEDASEGGGVGVFIEEASYGPSVVTMESSSVTDVELAAVWVQGPSAVPLIDNTLVAGSARDIGGGTEVHGDVIVARDEVSELRLEGNTISGAVEAGVLLHGSTAELAGNTWTGNAVDVLQQNCDESPGDVVGLEEVGTADICPEYDELVLDLHFDAYLTESLPN